MSKTPMVPQRAGRRLLPLGPVVCLAFLCLCVPGTSAMAATSVRDAHTKVARRIAKDLESLWGTARARKLGVEAEDTARLLLHFVQDHERARAWLGDTRGTDGSWQPAESPVERSNEEASDRVLTSFRKQHARKVKVHVKSLWRILDKAGEEVDAEDRNYLLADLRALAPEDARLDGLRYDVLRDGFWITHDLEVGDACWLVLYEKLLSIWKGHPKARPIELHPDLEWMDGVEWKTRCQVGEVGLWGECSEKEGAAIAKMCAQAGAVFPHLLKVEASLPKGFGVVLFDNTAPGDYLRSKLDGTEEEKRAREGSGAYLLPGTPLVVSARWQGAIVRQDTAVHLLTYKMFEEAFGLGPESAWAAQAVCLTMTKRCTGTRYTVMGGREKRRTEIDARLEGELYKEDAEWFETARKLANRGRLPGLGDIAFQPLTHLYVLELLACATNGAYLLMVHSDRAAAIFRRLGRGETTAEALQQELGITVEEWDRRVRRYVDDMSDYDPATSMRKKATKGPPR